MNEKGSERRRMVTDLEIARGVETVLRQSDPNAATTLSGIVSQVEANLGGLDLSHKAGFIRDHISFLLSPRPQFTALPQKDSFALHHSHHLPSHHPLLHYHPPPPTPQQQQQPAQLQRHQFFSSSPSPSSSSSHFALPPQQREISFAQPQQQQQQQPPLPATTGGVVSGSPAQLAQLSRKESAPKRRGGSGGLNKVCGVSTELQAIVGQPALPRTEIVKQLWAYIRKNNLQDPSNKRKIICDDALRVVFETDSTDMFKMNKLLAKHILPFDPSKESSQAKRLKVDTESPSVSTEGHSLTMLISEKLAKFLETGEREILRSEVHKQVWEYIKMNHLEDPSNPMEIQCDAKLSELFGCESISSQQVSLLLDRHHLFRQPS